MLYQGYQCRRPTLNVSDVLDQDALKSVCGYPMGCFRRNPNEFWVAVPERTRGNHVYQYQVLEGEILSDGKVKVVSKTLSGNRL